MGNTQGKKTSEQKKEILEVKKQIIASNISKLDDLNKNIDEKFNSNQINSQDYLKAKNIVSRGEKMVERGGKPLIKDDFIAIIINLNPEFLQKKEKLFEKTNDELIIIIRNIIYNPESIAKKVNKINDKIETVIATPYIENSKIPSAPSYPEKSGEKIPSAHEKIPSINEKIPCSPSHPEKIPSAPIYTEKMPSAHEKIPSINEKIPCSPSHPEKIPSAPIYTEKIPSAPGECVDTIEELIPIINNEDIIDILLGI